jgi:hypothetical protein
MQPAPIAQRARALREALEDKGLVPDGFLVRTGQLDRASSRVANWRRDSTISRLYGEAVLACSESAIARCRGHHRVALSHAKDAVESTSSPERHRYRVDAYCSLIERAVEAGALETARPYVEELSSWRDIQIGEQRCDIYHAEAAYYRALAAQAGPAGDPADAERRAKRAEEAARSAARVIDERLGTDHHILELDDSCCPVG